MHSPGHQHRLLGRATANNELRRQTAQIVRARRPTTLLNIIFRPSPINEPNVQTFPVVEPKNEEKGINLSSIDDRIEKKPRKQQKVRNNNKRRRRRAHK